MNDVDDDGKNNENIFGEMEEYNNFLHEKAEAFKKLAKALNENYERHLTRTRHADEDTMGNKPETE